MPDVTTVQLVLQAPNEVTVSEVQNTVTVSEVDPTQVFVQFPGTQGPPGTSVLSGIGAPSSGLGRNGDHYIDTSNGYFYGPKANGVWPGTPSFSLGANLRYIHTQAVASTTWTITHNLNTKPNVVILDSAGTHVFGDVTYSSDNQVILSFSAAFSGAAYLS